MSGGSRKRHLASIWAPFPTKVNKTMTKEADDIFFVFVCSHFQFRRVRIGRNSVVIGVAPNSCIASRC